MEIDLDTCEYFNCTNKKQSYIKEYRDSRTCEIWYVDKSNKYCQEHCLKLLCKAKQCNAGTRPEQMFGCDNCTSQNSDFCKMHKCYYGGCTNENKVGSYCDEHKKELVCNAFECNNSLKKGFFCQEHCCIMANCTSIRDNHLLCKFHKKQNVSFPWLCCENDCLNHKTVGSYCDAHKNNLFCNIFGCKQTSVGGFFCSYHHYTKK